MTRSSSVADSNVRPDMDKLNVDIATYVADHEITSEKAFTTAHYTFMDAIGCAYLALDYSECTRLLGPYVPGTTVPDGVPVPGTSHTLDPVKAAFDIGTLIRWLDYNDAWLAAEWGHPSDNFGAILAVADRVSRERIKDGSAPLTMRDVLMSGIKAYEIQGIIALTNSFNRVGIDHVILVRAASTAVATHLLGGSKEQIADALTLSWIDAGPLRTYRHAPNAGSRKSWAAGDAVSRAVRLAYLTMAGEMGYPSALTAPKWGFQDVIFNSQDIVLERPLDSYVIENILFKIPHATEFHAQTALEAAIELSPRVRDRLDEIDRIEIETHEAAVRIISKVGPLHNPADRDHSMQYIVAIGLIHGTMDSRFYEDEAAADPRIDTLREKMTVVENPDYSAGYLDPAKRSVASSIQIFFRDGTSTDRLEKEFPLGHPRRRDEGIRHVEDKFRRNVSLVLPQEEAEPIIQLMLDAERLVAMPVPEFMDTLHR